MNNTPSPARTGHAALPADGVAPVEAATVTDIAHQLEALRAERNLLKMSLEARADNQGDALQSIRRSQDLDAEKQRLQRALEQSQMRVVELEGRCRDMEEEHRGLLADRDASIRREAALQASLAQARMHFQERIEQLGQSLAALQRLRQPETPDDKAS